MVITNDKLETALEELRAVAARALAGETGGPLTAPPAAARTASTGGSRGGSRRDTPAGTPTAAQAAGSSGEGKPPTFKGWLEGQQSAALAAAHSTGEVGDAARDAGAAG